MALKITGTGKGLPQLEVSNYELLSYVDTSDEWIESRTGIKKRRLRTTETLADFAIEAAQNALDKANLQISDIDLVLCATIGGDYVTPSLSCDVAEKMGASCPAFDMNAACSGFLYALDTADAWLATGRAEHVLIICAEMMSRHIDWTHRSTCVLFGNGAGACVASFGGALRYIHLTASENGQYLSIPVGTGNSPFVERAQPHGYLHMDGRGVFKFAVSMAGKELDRALKALDLTADAIDLFLIHQANRRIVDAIRTRAKQGQEKFPMNIQNYGNISSASIPILLDECVEQGMIKAGDTLFMSAFGGGLTTGTAVLVWE